MERPISFIDGFAIDDYMVGTENGLFGGTEGFEVGALIRLPDPSNPAYAVDEEFLVFGNGDLTGNNPAGWAIEILREPPGLGGNWVCRFVLPFTGGPIFEFAEFQILADNLTTNRALFLHCFWMPDQSGPSYLGIYLNGYPAIIQPKGTPNFNPATTAPRVGNGVVRTPGDPPVPPRMGVSALSYREGPVAFDTRFSDAWRRVQTIDDIDSYGQPLEWDNIWSARWGFRDVTAQNQQWVDSVSGTILQRTGGGNSLAVNNAYPHYPTT